MQKKKKIIQKEEHAKNNTVLFSLDGHSFGTNSLKFGYANTHAHTHTHARSHTIKASAEAVGCRMK